MFPRSSNGMELGPSHIANEIVSHQVKLSCEKGSAIELRDKQPPPELSPGMVLTGTYVDNVQVLGGNSADVDRHMRSIVAWFEKLGIPFTTSGTEALSEFETLGMVFDMKRRRIRHRAKRAWRPYYATKALTKRGRINGETLRVWLGHVVNHFQLLRPAMACLHSCYRFVQAALGRRMLVWNSVRTEMRLDCCWPHIPGGHRLGKRVFNRSLFGRFINTWICINEHGSQQRRSQRSHATWRTVEIHRSWRWIELRHAISPHQRGQRLHPRSRAWSQYKIWSTTFASIKRPTLHSKTSPSTEKSW